MRIEDKDEANEALLMYEIARTMRIQFDRKAHHLGLTRSQWQVLSILRRYPGIHQTNIADRMEIKPITLVRLLDRMEKAGWIERRPDPADRRANQLHLTEKVKTIVGEMRTIVTDIRQGALAGFNDQEHKALVSYLHRIKSNLGADTTSKDMKKWKRAQGA